MKKLLFFIPFALLFAFVPKTEPLAIGADLPKADIKLKDVSGNEITLESAAGKNGLLVMFSCNTCPVVIENQSRAKEICAYAKKNNIGVVVLNSNEASRANSESLESMKSYAKAQGYNWYYAEDKNHVLADAFGATRTTECFLFNKDGKLIYHGAIDDSPQDAGSVKRVHLKEAINESVQGKNVSVQKTKSVGCGIKRLG